MSCMWTSFLNYSSFNSYLFVSPVGGFLIVFQCYFIEPLWNDVDGINTQQGGQWGTGAVVRKVVKGTTFIRLLCA